ncbi:MAG: hypothetical protein NVS3B25_07510 [Hymenobacter sp.]
MKPLLYVFAALLAAALLAVAHQFAQNGRYCLSAGGGEIIDTRTGAIYAPNAATGHAALLIQPVQ